MPIAWQMVGLDWIASQLGSRHEHGWDVLWKMISSSEKRGNSLSSFLIVKNPQSLCKIRSWLLVLGKKLAISSRASINFNCRRDSYPEKGYVPQQLSFPQRLHLDAISPCRHRRRRPCPGNCTLRRPYSMNRRRRRHCRATNLETHRGPYHRRRRARWHDVYRSRRRPAPVGQRPAQRRRQRRHAQADHLLARAAPAHRTRGVRQEPHVHALHVEVVLARRQHAHQRAVAELLEADCAAARRLRGIGIGRAADVRRGGGGVVRERREYSDVVGAEAERRHGARARRVAVAGGSEVGLCVRNTELKDRRL
jgi:hypothetical protein